jgi:hypothetical protein
VPARAEFNVEHEREGNAKRRSKPRLSGRTSDLISAGSLAANLVPHSG